MNNHIIYKFYIYMFEWNIKTSRHVYILIQADLINIVGML